MKKRTIQKRWVYREISIIDEICDLRQGLNLLATVFVLRSHGTTYHWHAVGGRDTYWADEPGYKTLDEAKLAAKKWINEEQAAGRLM